MAKGKKDRVTLLSSLAYACLLEYQKLYQPKEWVFEGAEGKPYSARSINNIIKRKARLAGIEKSVSAHTVRHSLPHTCRNAERICGIQVLLGHESSQTTERGFELLISPLDDLIRKKTEEANNDV